MEWIVGIVSGVITGTATCAFFYWLSGKDLKREANDLRRLNVLIIRALVNAGLAEVNFDGQGNPLGLVFRFEVGDGLSISDFASATIKRSPAGGGGVILGGTALVEVVRSGNPEQPAEG